MELASLNWRGRGRGGRDKKGSSNSLKLTETALYRIARNEFVSKVSWLKHNQSYGRCKDEFYPRVSAVPSRRLGLSRHSTHHWKVTWVISPQLQPKSNDKNILWSKIFEVTTPLKIDWSYPVSWIIKSVMDNNTGPTREKLTGSEAIRPTQLAISTHSPS